MRIGMLHISGVTRAFARAAVLALGVHVWLLQTASAQQSTSAAASNGSGVCFTATDPAEIVRGCDTFLSGNRNGSNASRVGLALQRRGGARAALGQTDQALADFRQMATSGYKVHEAQASIGSLEFQRHRLNEAEAAYREALKVNPSYALAQVGLGHTLIALSRPAEALDHFDRALAVSDQDTTAHLGKGTALAAQGDLDGAIRSFNAALQIDPRLLNALYQRAQAYNDKGDVQKALVDADAAVGAASGFEKVRALIYRGRLRNNAKRYDDVIADCSAADTEATRLNIADAALRAAANVCLGLAYQSKGNLGSAQQSYDRALTWDANDLGALTGRGYVLLQRGQYDGAVADFTAALKVDPKSQDALRFIGLAYSDKGDRNKASEAFARAISADARDPWPLMIRAISFARDGQRESANADVSRALAITGQRSSDAVLVRGAVNYFLGDFDKARADLDQALRLNPDNGQAHRTLARLLIRLGRFDEAQRSQDRAAQLMPHDSTVLLQQGLIALGRRDFAGAVRELTASLDINDAQAEGFAARGQAHEALGLTAAAIADYRLALAKLALDDDSRAAVTVARARLAVLTGAGNPGTAAVPGGSPAGQPGASFYCRLAEGVFVRSRKYTGVEFDVGCRS